MTAEPSDNPISSESDFFQRVKKRTLGTIGWERVEPANESGFPDTYFVVKRRGQPGAEGTLEFKYAEKVGAPDLPALMRGNQKAALLEYQKMGGARRFYLVYTGRGEVWLYTTDDAVKCLLGDGGVSAMAQMEEPSFTAWLVQCLTRPA